MGTRSCDCLAAVVLGVVGFAAAAIRLRLTHRGAARAVSGGPEAL